jgi:hypothetical protein
MALNVASAVARDDLVAPVGPVRIGNVIFRFPPNRIRISSLSSVELAAGHLDRLYVELITGGGRKLPSPHAT